MKRVSLIVVVALLALAGCKNGVMGLGAKSPDIEGKWKGEIKMATGSKDDPMAKFGEAMAQMMLGNLTLEFLPGDKFKLTMMGMPIEGSYKRDGLELTLTAEKAMGMTPEELKNNNPGFKTDKLHATISPEGDKITVRAGDEKKEDGEMVFVRYKEEPEKERKSTVAEGENSLVGSYGCEIQGDKPANMSEKEQQEWAMGEMLLKSATLDLYSDNTFKMTLMLEMKGTWKVENGIVKLHMETMMGMPEDAKSTSKGDDMNLRIAPGGKLIHEEKGPGGSTMAFVKK